MVIVNYFREAQLAILTKLSITSKAKKKVCRSQHKRDVREALKRHKRFLL